MRLPASQTGRVGAGVVFGVALVVYGIGASFGGLVKTDEHRYTEVARQVGSAQAGWWVPYLNGEPYADKPPGYFWTAALLREGLGLASDRAALAASALAAALAVALVYGMGRRLFDGSAALAAAVVLASTAAFAGLAARATLDALLATSMTLALWAYVRSLEAPRRRWWAAVGGAVGAGILIKGPVAAFVVGLVIALHRLVVARRAPIPRGGLVLALACTLLPVAAWFLAAASQAGWGYVEYMTLRHGVGHALGHVDKQRPAFFYAGPLADGLAPWILLAPAALWWSRTRWREPGVALALVWGLATVVALSLFPAKRQNYLAPVFPGWALLAGAYLAALARRGPEPGAAGAFLARVWRLGLGVGAVGAGVAAVALGVAVLVPPASRPALPGSAWLEAGRLAPGAVALGVAAGGALAWAGVALLRNRTWDRAVAWSLAAGGALAVLIPCAVRPIEAAGAGTDGFYAQVAPLVGDAPLASYGGADFSANWSLGRTRVDILRGADDVSRWIDDEGSQGWLVAEAGDLERWGMPPDARTVLVQPRPLADPLVLLRVTPPGEPPSPLPTEAADAD